MRMLIYISRLFAGPRMICRIWQMFLPAFFVPLLSVHSQTPLPFPGFTLDFETRNLAGWNLNTGDTNNAFYYQPTYEDNPTARHRGQPANQQGKFWIGTYEKYQGLAGQTPGSIQGDWPQGILSSRYFKIPAGTLSFLIGGGSSFNTRVELLTSDQAEHQETRAYFATGRNMETMYRVTWDLSPYAGKAGRIRIVDSSSAAWGHINADDFVFTPPDTTRHDTVIPPPDQGAKQVIEIIQPVDESRPSNKYWWWIIIGVTVVISASLILWRIKKPGKADKLPKGIRIIPHADPGVQQTEPSGASPKDKEIRFRPVADAGVQEIITGSSLIESERRDTSHE